MKSTVVSTFVAGEMHVREQAFVLVFCSHAECTLLARVGVSLIKSEKCICGLEKCKKQIH